MHDFQEQRQTIFRTTVCLSLFSSNQCIIKKLLDLVFVTSEIIIKVSVTLALKLIIPDITKNFMQ